MSNNKRYRITINEPCNEAWSEMTPLDCGRFCSSCNKVVHDLTNLSEAALQNWASEQNGPVCGRLKADQLSNSTEIGFAPKSKWLHKMVAGFLAAASLSSILPVNAQSTFRKPGFKTERAPTPLKPVFQVDDSLKFRIHGFISDSISEKPLPGTHILIDHKVMAVTDVDGQYSFVLPKEYQKAIVEVTAEKMNSHQSITDIIRLRKLPAELNFVLKEHEPREKVVVSAGIVAIVVDDKKAAPKRRTWYQKIWGKSGN